MAVDREFEELNIAYAKVSPNNVKNSNLAEHFVNALATVYIVESSDLNAETQMLEVLE